jgi:branched-chain amino acid transport system ATP-binding protein
VTPLLEIDGLEVAYGRVNVLNGVSLRVGAGEVVALLGTNGAGKSTLLKAVSGIVSTRAGSIRLDGEELRRRRPIEIVRRGVVQVPGGRATFPGLTVKENLRIGAMAAPAVERRGRIDEVVAQFPWLGERAAQLAGTLSGGQQQILALARALLARPRLLMVDELSLGLAPAIVAELLHTLTGLAQQGVGLVIVDQHVDLALDVSDRAYFLERGAVRFEGAASDLRGRTDLLRAVLLAGAESGS